MSDFSLFCSKIEEKLVVFVCRLVMLVMVKMFFFYISLGLISIGIILCDFFQVSLLKWHSLMYNFSISLKSLVNSRKVKLSSKLQQILCASSSVSKTC